MEKAGIQGSRVQDHHQQQQQQQYWTLGIVVLH
jgi:hypothetical protein